MYQTALILLTRAGHVMWVSSV